MSKKELELKDLIGKTVSKINDRWDGENEGDSIDVQFSDGTILDVYVNRQPGGCSDLGIETCIRPEPTQHRAKDTQ